MNAKWKTIFYYAILPLLIAICLLRLLFIIIVLNPRDAFNVTYQSVIQDKYENLVSETEKKIILIGGSSLGFGINEELLSQQTGYSVVNLGLHAGFGGLFPTELSKANIKEDDIILLAYEYGWQQDGYFDKFGVDLVMSGIDSKIEMYKYIPSEKWPEIIGYLPEYCKKKTEPQTAAGTYSRSSFDENGHMILPREFKLFDYEEKKDVYQYVTLEKVNISEHSSKYLQEYKEYVEEKGAEIYFVAPPLYEKAKQSSDESFVTFVQQVEAATGIEYISDPLEYIFEEKYMFDTIYHCSTVGEIKRTELLISDLKESGVIN